MPMSRTQQFRLAVLLAFAVTEAGPALACASSHSAASATGAGGTVQVAAAGTIAPRIGSENQPEDFEMAAGDVDPMVQLAGTWFVTEIATVEIPPGPDITLDFDGYLLRGTAPCNTFEAAVNFTDIGIGFGPVEAGGNVCSSEKMAAEAALFQALGTVDRYDVDEDDNLTFYGSDVAVLFAQRR